MLCLENAFQVRSKDKVFFLWKQHICNFIAKTKDKSIQTRTRLSISHRYMLRTFYTIHSFVIAFAKVWWHRLFSQLYNSAAFMHTRCSVVHMHAHAHSLVCLAIAMLCFRNTICKQRAELKKKNKRKRRKKKIQIIKYFSFFSPFHRRE